MSAKKKTPRNEKKELVDAIVDAIKVINDAKKTQLHINTKPFVDAYKANTQLLKVARSQVIRPLVLKASARKDRYLPPESPSTKRRGKSSFAPDFIQTAIGILDTAETGRMNEFLKADIVAACKKGDWEFFRMIGKIAEHLDGTPLSVHARHVIEVKKAAAAIMKKGTEPNKAAMVVLGRAANGWLEWKNKDGVPIDQLRKKAAAEVVLGDL
jgi:hypothetical protein